MNYNEWINKYKPVNNHLDDEADFNNQLFEIYGKELDFVLKSNHVWTLIEGDKGLYISKGYHIVNRLGYFITQNYTKDFLEIKIED